MEGLIPLVYRVFRRHTSRRNYENLTVVEAISERHGHMGCFSGFSVENSEVNGKRRFRKGKSVCLRMQDFGEKQDLGEEQNKKRERLRSKSLAF